MQADCVLLVAALTAAEEAPIGMASHFELRAAGLACAAMAAHSTAQSAASGPEPRTSSPALERLLTPITCAVSTQGGADAAMTEEEQTSEGNRVGEIG